MKPNFALSLSFDGIQLLHRALGGWRVVGDVPLDAADLDAELAVLRKTATALEPGGLRCKLLIPDAQIKYLSIDTPDPSGTARLRAAHLALEGATPYALDELAFDIQADGAKTHIAAVARDTLEEAESFAVEHRFHPVSFVAAPKRGSFPGEPFFGPTEAAAALLDPGETVEPDREAVVILDIASAAAKAAQRAPVADLTGLIASGRAGDPEPPAPDMPKPTPEDPVRPDPTPTPEPSPAPQPEDPSPVDPPREAPQPDIPQELPDLPAPPETPQRPDPSPTPEPTPAPQPQDPSPTPPPSEAPPPSAPPEVPQQHGRSAESRLRPAQPQSAHGAADVGPPVQTANRDANATVTPEAASASLRPAAPGTARINAPELVPSPYVAASRKNAAQRLVAFASRRRADAAEARREPLVAPPAPPPPSKSVTTAPVLPALPSAAGAASSLSAALATPSVPGPASAAKTQVGAASRPAQQRPPTRNPAASEAEQMTIFGARKTAEVGGKPRFLGLTLTAALLILLASVAAWASVFLDEGLNLSRLFGDRAEPQVIASVKEENESVGETTPPAVLPDAEPEAEAEPDLTPEDGAVLDALRAPRGSENAPLTAAEIEAKYAVSGVWPLAPDLPPEPAALIGLEDLYFTGIDPVSTSSDAIALPPVASYGSDAMLDGMTSPAAAGTDFTLDERGLVAASAKGTLSPDGIMIYLGRPKAVPPTIPTRAEAEPQDTRVLESLVKARPQDRPEDLAEQTERAQLDGMTRSELAGLRPKQRPAGLEKPAEPELPAAPGAGAVILQETDKAVSIALTNPPAIQNATPQATEISRRPDDRPRNFARIVKRAERSAPAEVSAPAAVVAPSIPTKTSVSKQATVTNAINLRKINLIGVYGKPANRRALVRLGNGRYQKVVVGDRIDGGRVAAIGESELRYVKGGRNVVLTMPKS